MLRSLIHYRHLNVAVLFGVAVAAAVLTGALMVGDSVRASLRAMTFDRLSLIDYAIVTEGFVPDDLETRLAANSETRVAGTVFLQGSARHQGRLATGVQVLGVTEGFDALFEEPIGLAALLPSEQGQPFPSAILNQPLADELDIAVGDDLLISFENISDINRDSVYGDKERDAIVARTRVRVRAVIPATGPGRFALGPSQNLPKTVMLPRAALQRALERPGEINVVLAGQPDREGGYMASLNEALRETVTLADLGLEQRTTETYFSLETPNFFLRASVVATAHALAEEQNLEVLETSSYLANQLTHDGRAMPYSLITALELGGPLAADEAVVGSTDLGPDEVVTVAVASGVASFVNGVPGTLDGGGEPIAVAVSSPVVSFVNGVAGVLDPESTEGIFRISSAVTSYVNGTLAEVEGPVGIASPLVSYENE